MSNTCPTTAVEILNELTELESLVKTVTPLVENGEQVNLGVMGERIGLICDAAVALPAEQSRPLLPIMEQLIHNLDALTEQLSTSFGHLPNLRNEAAPSAAASAYGRNHSRER